MKKNFLKKLKNSNEMIDEGREHPFQNITGKRGRRKD
jgi:hypothetical protein